MSRGSGVVDWSGAARLEVECQLESQEKTTPHSPPHTHTTTTPTTTTTKDLPGYGYAKASKTTAASWLGFTKEYFLERDALVAVLLLADASLPPQPLDLECASWLAESEVPFAVVFTKADARKKSGPTPQQNVAAFKKALLADWETPPPCFETSSREGRGKSELLGFLAGMRRLDRDGG